MNRHKSIYRKSAVSFLRGAVLPLLFTSAIIVMTVYGLRQTQSSSDSEGLKVLEDSIRRAVVTSYAIEGRYPESIEYIQSRYGIYIDKTKYVVHYNIIASNIMPEIRVIEV